MTTTQQLRLIIAGLLLALAGTIYYYNMQQADAAVSKSVCMDFNQYQPSTLKTGLVGDMVSIYRTKQLADIKVKSGMDDAYSVWFDLDSIKKFIYHIEKGVEQNATAGSDNRLGLRFYYASYPDHTTWSDPAYTDLSGFAADPSKQNYEYKHTLVLLPTINIAGNDKDFNPFSKATFTTGLPKYTKPSSENKEPITIDNSPAAGVDVFAITGSKDVHDPIDNRTAKNHGGLYPPDNMNGLSF